MTTDLPHCKAPGHLNVVATDLLTGHGADETIATLVKACQCHQAPDVLQPVVVIGSPHHPGEGMHLLPEAWPYLAGNLRAVAGASPDSVISLQHTVEHEWRTWRSFTAAGALDLARRISEAAQAAQL